MLASDRERQRAVGIGQRLSSDLDKRRIQKIGKEGQHSRRASVRTTLIENASVHGHSKLAAANRLRHLERSGERELCQANERSPLRGDLDGFNMKLSR